MRFILTVFLVFTLCLAQGQAPPAPTTGATAGASAARPSGPIWPTGDGRADSLRGAIRGELQTMKRENELYRVALDVNANLFGGISTYLAAVALLLSVIVVAIPLVSYFLVYKPNEKLVAKVAGLESEVLGKIEQNFENYFTNLRKLKNQKMLALLDDPARVSEVTDYFFLNSPDSLEEADVARIVAALKADAGIEKPDLLVLHSLLSSSRLPAVEKYYKGIFEADDQPNYAHAIAYLVDNNFPEHLPYVEKIIAAANQGHVLLLDFFDYIAQRYLGNWRDQKSPEKQAIGVRYVTLLFNSDKILAAIAGEPAPSHHNDARMGRRMDINHLLAHPFLRETKYYSPYLQETDEKHAANRPRA